MVTSLPLFVLGAAMLLTLSIADSVPKLNVAAGCKEAAKVNQGLDLSEAQSYESCMRDEDSARIELTKDWASYHPIVRERCVAETKENAAASYVEVLVCIRIAQDPSNKAILEEFKKQNR